MHYLKTAFRYKGPPTLFQSHFLTEHLRLVDFERKLSHDPLDFLDDVVRAFRRYVPFNTVRHASILLRDDAAGKWPLAAAVVSNDAFFDAVRSEILSGRGGPCFVNNPFLAHFLRSLGFDASLVIGYVSPDFRRDVPHATVHVRSVEEVNDRVFFDVGTFWPMMRAVKIRGGGDGGGTVDGTLADVVVGPFDDGAVVEGKFVSAVQAAGASASLSSNHQWEPTSTPPPTRSFRDVHAHYRIITDDHYDASILSKKEEFSPCFDMATLVSRQRTGESGPIPSPSPFSFATVVKIDAIFRAMYPKLDLADGHWMPFLLVPSATTTVSVEDDARRRRSFLSRATTEERKRIFDYGASLCRVSGFGRQSGDFFIFTKRQRVRCPGSGRSRLREDTVEAAAIADDAVSVTVATADASSAAVPEVTTPSTREELLALFDEEFPQLTDSYKSNLEYLDRERKRGELR